MRYGFNRGPATQYIKGNDGTQNGCAPQCRLQLNYNFGSPYCLLLKVSRLRGDYQNETSKLPCYRTINYEIWLVIRLRTVSIMISHVMLKLRHDTIARNLGTILSTAC